MEELGVEIHLVKENIVLSQESRSHEKFAQDAQVATERIAAQQVELGRDGEAFLLLVFEDTRA